jgi:hypothetical protein
MLPKLRAFVDHVKNHVKKNHPKRRAKSDSVPTKNAV